MDPIKINPSQVSIHIPAPAGSEKWILFLNTAIPVQERRLAYSVTSGMGWWDDLFGSHAIACFF